MIAYRAALSFLPSRPVGYARTVLPLIGAAGLVFGGCSILGGRSRPMVEVTVMNPTGASQRLRLDLDGKSLWNQTIAPGQIRQVEPIVAPGTWMRFSAMGEAGEERVAMVRADRPKSITVRVDPARPGGVGIHIQDRPR